MADSVTVWPVFFHHSIDVKPAEARSLRRQGLLKPDPPALPDDKPEDDEEQP